VSPLPPLFRTPRWPDVPRTAHRPRPGREGRCARAPTECRYGLESTGLIQCRRCGGSGTAFCQMGCASLIRHAIQAPALLLPEIDRIKIFDIQYTLGGIRIARVLTTSHELATPVRPALQILGGRLRIPSPDSYPSRRNRLHTSRRAANIDSAGVASTVGRSSGHIPFPVCVFRLERLWSLVTF